MHRCKPPLNLLRWLAERLKKVTTRYFQISGVDFNKMVTVFCQRPDWDFTDFGLIPPIFFWIYSNIGGSNYKSGDSVLSEASPCPPNRCSKSETSNSILFKAQSPHRGLCAFCGECFLIPLPVIPHVRVPGGRVWR